MSTTASEPAQPVRYGSRLVSFVLGTLLAGGLAVLLLWHAVLVRIPPGHVGVLYSLLGGGTVMNYVLPEGLALKLPWNQIYIFDVRFRVMPLTINALSTEGLQIGLKAALVYRVDPSSPDALLKQVGTDYANGIIAPLAEGAIRRVVAIHDTHRLYAHDTQAMTQEVLSSLRGTFRNTLIDFYDVVFPQITLPAPMVQAIEDKLKHEQVAASYEFILSSARSEAERRRIEALGLHNYYSIVAEALSKDLLTWAGIQATVDLSKSPNSKVVVVGGGQNQMPLILGSDIAGAAASAPRPGVLDFNARPLAISPSAPDVKPIEPTDPAKGVDVPGNARLTPLPPPTPNLPPHTLPVGRDMVRPPP